MSRRSASTPFEVSLNWKVVFGLAEPEVSGWARVRAAQLGEMLRVFPAIATIQLINALLLIWLLRDSVAPLWAAVWLGATLMALAVTAALRRQARTQLPHRVRTGAMRRSAAQGLLTGLLWSVPPLLFSGGATEPQKAGVCLVGYGMLTLGTLTASTMPQVALLFIAGSAIGLTAMIARLGEPLVVLLPPAFAITLATLAFYNGRAFIARTCAEIALEEKSEVVSLLLREFEENGADWLWQIDSARQLVHVSSRLAYAAGCEPAELEGQPLLRLFAGEQWQTCALDPAVKDMIDRLQRRESVKDHLLPIDVRGETRWWSISAAPRYDAQGLFVGFHGVGSDRTDQRRSEARIDQMARIDPLTGLSNRREITAALRNALTLSFQNRGRCALLLIDLDRFKAVNDTLGHPIGDRLLKLVAERLTQQLRVGDIAGRLGGDEFAVVAADAGNVDRIRKLAAAIVRVLCEPFAIDHHVIRIGGSVGYAFGPRDGRSIETLMRHADVALYQAKKDGRGVHRQYDPMMLAEGDRRRRIEAALREALDEGALHLVYHPLADPVSGRVTGYEARTRWDDPRLSGVADDDLMVIAEEAQLTRRIGEWTLRTACADAAHWPEDIRLSLDLVGDQLLDSQFAATLLSALSHGGLAPARLEINIPEPMLIDPSPDALATMDRLRGLGVRLALTGFGSGGFTLGIVRIAELGAIKLAPAIVQEAVAGDEGAIALICGIVAMAESLDIDVVARGVDSADTWQSIQALGCREVGGAAAGDGLPASAIAAQGDEQAPRAAA